VPHDARSARPAPARAEPGDGAVRTGLREARDRFVASDPGFGRLRTATSAVVCVGTALPVQLAVSRLLGYQGQVTFAATIFGAVVAMLGSNALVGSDRREKVRTAVFFPLAVAIGLVPAVGLHSSRLAQVVGFAVVLFGAVWVRRFGPSWFFFGFMTWMGFFFATFLQATWSIVPELLAASVVSTAWVLLLTTTVLRPDPRKVLRSTLDAFSTRGRSVAREAADVLAATQEGHGHRARARALRRLASAGAGMAETALLADAWSAEAGAVPPGWSAAAVRRRAIETQQAAERFAGAATSLVDGEPGLLDEARRTLRHLAARRDRAAGAAADRLSALADEVEQRDGAGWWAARHVAFGVREFVRFEQAADEPPEVDPGEEEFEAATGLAFGGLPGAPAVAKEVAARGSRFNPVARTSMTTRQAVQVMLAGVAAIALGTALSPTRYYWAVIAVFVTFTGTGTRSETFLKGASRIGGTLVGLVAAIALAHVTAGHTVAIFAAILVSIFLAFYLNKVSYAAMTFFITVLLGQLYTVLGTFSDKLLALRLGETAVGAGAGVLVALVFAPLSTRDTVRSARDQVLASLAALLDGVAEHVEGPAEGRRVDLDGLTRVLDDDARRLALAAKPLTRPLVVGHSSRSTRRRLGLFVAAVSQCRALAVALQRHGAADPRAAATAARALAAAARELGHVDVGEEAPDAEPMLRLGDRALFGAGISSTDRDPVVRHLQHLAGTLTQLAETRIAPEPVPRHRAG
jgi:uncharacterized membrane protein YccC